MRFSAATVVVFSSIVALGCTTTPKLTFDPTINVYYVIDKGVPTDSDAKQVDAKQIEQRDQVGTSLSESLFSALKRRGINSTPLRAQGDFKPSAKNYLLVVKITRYDAGNKAARMLVGFGAGSASMDSHFELSSAPGKVVDQGDPSIASGRDWRFIVQKTTEIISSSVERSLAK